MIILLLLVGAGGALLPAVGWWRACAREQELRGDLERYQHALEVEQHESMQLRTRTRHAHDVLKTVSAVTYLPKYARTAVDEALMNWWTIPDENPPR